MEESTSSLLRAQWVAPMDGPLLHNAAVAIANGRILAIGPWTDVRSQHPTFPISDLGPTLLLPGLVNAHTHLELTTCRSDQPHTGHFTDWVLRLPRPQDAQSIESLVTTATRQGIAQSLRFGVTCVGDITQHPHLSRPVLRQSPLRVTSYAEVLGMGTRRPRFEHLLAQATRREALAAAASAPDLPDPAASPPPRLLPALSPHAPYSVDLPGYRQCLALAIQHHLPLATHLAELPEEQAFLEQHTGPFRQLLQTLGAWTETIETYPASPVRFAHAIGLLDYPTLLAHVNYCDDEELSLLARGRAAVVYCPRTHRYFHHPPHRWRHMLAAGVNVAVGTDSCASSPDLNLVDEIRLLHQLAPDAPPAQLWQMATLNAARAVRRQHDLGSLTPGKRADLTAFPVTTSNPLLQVLESTALPAAVWIDGRRLPSS